MRSTQWQWVLLVAFTLSATPSHRTAAQSPQPIPEPTGKYAVGRLEIDTTDSSRDEVFTAEPTDKRRLLVTVYYPANVPVGAAHAPYGTPELVAAYPRFTEESKAWLSPGYSGVPAADGRFPVLVFSPGLGNPTLYYSSLLYELASRGFVIAALWHPYSTEIVAFPDGTVVHSSELGGMNGGSPDTQAARLAQLGNVWVDDQRFVVTELTAWNTTNPRLSGRLDPERVGAFGHSLGGASAAQAAHVDSRIDAAINMDGAMFGTVTKDPQGSRAPFLLIRGEVPVPTDAELQQIGMTRAQAEAWLGTIHNEQAALIERTRGGRSEQLEHSRHNTFMTDILFLPGIPEQVRAGLVGDVESAAAFRQISAWIADFMTTHVERNAAQ